MSKVYKPKLKIISTGTFSTPNSDEGVIPCAVSTESKFHPERGFLASIPRWLTSGEAPCIRKLFSIPSLSRLRCSSPQGTHNRDPRRL